MSYNKICIIGNLGRDPELRYTQQNVPVCTFSVATSEKRRDKNGESESGETTTWFRVTAWRNQAEAASKYLKKGSQVYVEGRLAAREWQDREGALRTSLEVTASEIQFISVRDAAPGVAPVERPASGGGAAAPTYDAPVSDDDIPF
jgi:single-strand DNA-binding protein